MQKALKIIMNVLLRRRKRKPLVLLRSGKIFRKQNNDRQGNVRKIEERIFLHCFLYDVDDCLRWKLFATERREI